METLILISLITLFLGIIIGYFVRQVVVRNQVKSAEQKIKAQIEDAKTRAKEIILDAKDKAAAILTEAQKEERERKKDELVLVFKIFLLSFYFSYYCL